MSLFVNINHGNIRSFALLWPHCSRISGITSHTKSFATLSTLKEEFRDIRGFSKYRVSSFGNVKNTKHNKLRFINYDRYKKLNSSGMCTLISDCGQVKNFILARLVLQTFDPRSNDDSLCAFHVDGNRYNDYLSNLRWETQRNIKPNLDGRSRATPIILQNEQESIEFASARHCKEYLGSVDIHCSAHSISRWCREQAQTHGFHFLFKDQTKYEPIVDLPNEEWKLFYSSASNKTYYVSSKGRIKRVTKSRSVKEVLLASPLVNGYYRCSGNRIRNQQTYIHRLVAEHFVSNPNQYEMVDHIDAHSLNNDAENLRWVANQKENYENPVSRQRQSYGSQNKRKLAQMSLIDDTVIKIWDRAFCVKTKFGWKTSYILQACRNQRTSAYGCKWRFLDDMDVNKDELE